MKKVMAMIITISIPEIIYEMHFGPKAFADIMSKQYERGIWVLNAQEFLKLSLALFWLLYSKSFIEDHCNALTKSILNSIVVPRDNVYSSPELLLRGRPANIIKQCCFIWGKLSLFYNFPQI